MPLGRDPCHMSLERLDLGMCRDRSSSANPGFFKMDLKCGFLRVPPTPASQHATTEDE